MITNRQNEQRWALRYISTIDGTEKVCYPTSEAKRDEQLEICKKRGIRVISCKKLYPFSSIKNQHNFELIANICYNTMHDMETGEAAWNDAEYDRLEAMKAQAERFFCLPLPVAWIPYEDLRAAKELAAKAIMHRQEACIRNGRPELVALCAE